MTAVGNTDAAQQTVVELRRIADALARDAALRDFFTNRMISSAQKSIVLHDACGSTLGETAQQLLRVLMTHDALGDLHAILDAAQQDIDRQGNIARATITSAIHLSNAMRLRIEQTLEKKLSRDIHASYTVRPDCIGGFRIEIDGSRLWDGTIRARFDRLRARLASV